MRPNHSLLCQDDVWHDHGDIMDRFRCLRASLAGVVGPYSHGEVPQNRFSLSYMAVVLRPRYRVGWLVVTHRRPPYGGVMQRVASTWCRLRGTVYSKQIMLG